MKLSVTKGKSREVTVRSTSMVDAPSGVFLVNSGIPNEEDSWMYYKYQCSNIVFKFHEGSRVTSNNNRTYVPNWVQPATKPFALSVRDGMAYRERTHEAQVPDSATEHVPVPVDDAQEQVFYAYSEETARNLPKNGCGPRDTRLFIKVEGIWFRILPQEGEITAHCEPATEPFVRLVPFTGQIQVDPRS